MKSIFRKIAFVLALAMVVTLFPVMSASAAVQDNKYARKKNATLYVGGEYTNADYETCWSVQPAGKKLKTEQKYSITYVSSNTDVATVNKYGLVEAKSVGTTTITVTFEKDGEETIEESFDVKVNKNAVKVALNKESQDALAAGLTVGDESITLVAVKTSFDGAEDATDTVKFYCGSKEDKEIIDLDADTGKLTAKKAGEATVVVNTYQTEYDRETKKTKTVKTASEEYKVVVKEAGIVSAKQVNWNTVAITCGSETAAADIVANITKLTVTYKLAEKDITAYIKEAKVDDSNKKVALVTLYDNLVKDYIYTFKYGEASADVRGADLTAVAQIKVANTTAVINEETKLSVKYYDANGIELPAASQTASLPRFEVSGTAGDYFFNGIDSIYFYEVGKSATVVATYVRKYNTDGTEDKVTSAPTLITAVNRQVANDQIDGWAIEVDGKNSADLTYSQDNQRLVVGENKVLYGKYTITESNGNKIAGYTKGDTSFEYTSTNDSVLIVGSDGSLYPAKEGSATIIVRKSNGTDKVVVGTCSFTVIGSRILTGFKATVNKNKLSIGATPNDTAKITTIFTDQLGNENSAGNVSYTFEAVRWVDGLTLNIGNYTLDDTHKTVTTLNDQTAKEFSLSATSTKASGTKGNIQLVIIATQGTRSVRSSVSFDVKNVSAATNYNLELTNANIDLNVSAFGDKDGISKLQSDINLVGYDADGFVVTSQKMNTSEVVGGSDTYKYEVFKDGRNCTGAMASNGVFSSVVVSASAVTSSSIKGTITKQPTGLYQVMLYKKNANGEWQQNKFQNIIVKDSDINAVTVKVEDVNGIYADLSNIGSKLTFYRGGKKIESANIVNVKAVNAVAVGGTANRYYVPEVEVTERINGDSSIKDYTYTYKVRVGATFYQ